MALQMSVLGFMRQGFDQSTAERMVTCLSLGAGHLQAYPPMALPFLEPYSTSVVHSGFELNPGLRHAWGLLRYLEAQSLAGNTVVEVSDLIVRLCSAKGSSDVDGQGAVEGGGSVEGSFSGASDDVIEAIRQCEHRGWIAATEGRVQLDANYRLQSAVRHHLTRICGPFHPLYSEREIEHAFRRLSAFTPDMFAFDMLDEVTLALNSRVLLVRYDDIKAAIVFTQQYCAVSELLTNNIPTPVTVAKARCAAYETSWVLLTFRSTR